MLEINIELKKENNLRIIKVTENAVEWYYNKISSDYNKFNSNGFPKIEDNELIKKIYNEFNSIKTKLEKTMPTTEYVDNKLSIINESERIYDINTNSVAKELADKIITLVEQKEPKIKPETIHEKILNFVNSSEYKKQEITYKWDIFDNLRNVSDESLEFVLFLLKKAMYKIQIRDNKLILINNIKNLCDYESTQTDLLKNPNKYLTEKNTEFTVPCSLTVNRICQECKYQRCPKHLLAYVHYLASTSQLEAKLKDREKNKNKNESYTFDWKYNEIFKYIPEEMYKFCNELCDKNKVYVSRYLINDLIEIDTQHSCLDYKLAGFNIDMLPPKVDNPIYIKRRPNKISLSCDSQRCGLPGCVISIAGLIKYLKESGREKEIEEQRKYYNENKEECEKKYKELFESETQKYTSDIEEYINKLKEHKNSNLDTLITILEKKRLNNLYITIEGNDKTEKQLVIKNINSILYNIKKINNSKPDRITLSNLASNNAYPYTTRDGEKRDKNNVAYNTYEGIKTTLLKNENLYVIDEIGEFVKEFNTLISKKDMGGYICAKKKQYTHIIDLLVNISENNYIILDATEEEIDSLLKLDTRLQYIYQNNRFIIPEYPIEETFDVFMKNLNNNLYDKLKEQKEKYKKQFLEYVGLNKTFIPFDNRELASYLAMYCNMKDNITFPENIYKKETVEEALKNIIGLDKVKENVKKFEKYMLFKLKAKTNNLKLNDTNMHMIFTGNPGTGKTTIARIMAKMLYDMGIIKENKLIEVERKDLVAEYIGQTATKTSEVISKAMGGVLFIDEAYTLSMGSQGDYGKEAVATLIKAMEDHKDKLVVIFAGYKKEMHDFLEINPGILSRIGYKFDFPDYTSDELIQIFDKKIKNMGFEYEPDCNIKLLEIFEYFSRKKSFGNGRFVDKLIQEVMLNHAVGEGEKLELITSNDIPTINEINNSNDTEQTTDELLKDIIGLEKLKTKIKEFEEYVKFINEARKKELSIPNQNMHMIFTGNPGTGKTTIARIMTKMLYNAGILHDNNLVEVERKDLVAEYVGQTAIKTSSIIERAMGGILFIDEAYSLTNGGKNDFGSEAIATLIKAMEDHKGEFIVIFAGYKKEMAEFIESNSGIASRIGYTFEFEDYTREELAEILYSKIKKSKLVIKEESKEKVAELMNYFAKVENIGNGRFADKVFQTILMKHAKNKHLAIEIITPEDIPSIKEMNDTLFDGSNMINPEEITEKALRKTAIHEIGHAFVRYKLFDTPNIVKITINSEGTGVLGYVQMKISKAEYTKSKSNLLNTITVSLAGMVSEQIFLGEFENGNTSDLEKATSIANRMVTAYGMSKLGLGKISKVEGEMAVVVQKEINDILQECYNKAENIINENKEQMEKVIEYLYNHKEIDEETFLKVLFEQ